jgi:hypothetical protein
MNPAGRVRCNMRAKYSRAIPIATSSKATEGHFTMSDRCEYLLAELRPAALRARLWQADIDAVGLALKAGLISPDQAVEHLSDYGLLRLLGCARGVIGMSWGDWQQAARDRKHGRRQGTIQMDLEREVRQA